MKHHPPSRVPRARARRRQAGQALVEYTVALVVFLSVVLMLAFFLAIFSEQGWRLMQLIGLEYP